ncbi:hypothetical protein ACPA9J_19055 [Pseudomonas aeruginosa]
MMQNIHGRDDFAAACRSTCTPYRCPASPVYRWSRQPGWRLDRGGSAHPPDRYSNEGPRTTDLAGQRRGQASPHRRGSLLNLLIGFALSGVSNGWRSGASATRASGRSAQSGRNLRNQRRQPSCTMGSALASECGVSGISLKFTQSLPCQSSMCTTSARPSAT